MRIWNILVVLSSILVLGPEMAFSLPGGPLGKNIPRALKNVSSLSKEIAKISIPSRPLSAPTTLQPPPILTNSVQLQSQVWQFAQVQEASQNLLEHTFRARSTDDPRGEKAVSGTLFEIIENGVKQTYGVVATHALVNDGSGELIKRFFLADVYVEGTWKQIPAQIVQLTSPETWDVSLVKFFPKDETALSGFSLSSQSAQVGDSINTVGFVRKYALFLPERPVVDVSAYSLRSPISLPRSNRAGLCGSAWTNKQGELVGIHTGSRSSSGQARIISYATPSWILPALVMASEREGQVFFPFSINGQKITDLRLDEYVYSIDFLDKKKRFLGSIEFPGKFSAGKVAKAFKLWPARYINLSTAYTLWDKQDPSAVVFYTKARNILYDVKMKQIVSETK